eukprot:TRINITY_DN52077_c0_g1_i1.p1 TRINITY_DN52077_c0_g1~~TRINITY_DN52077_c0_g1_i1.p1  ORF type:complete len:620 (+),score=60.10 TRINITY_DN52077_c0_g1_i1:23-1882(+)
MRFLRRQTTRWLCSATPSRARLCVGIDLGNSNSSLSYIGEDSQARQVCPPVPSLSAFGSNGQRLFGDGVATYQLVHSALSAFSTKRLIGRQYDSKDTLKAHHEKAQKLVKTATGHVALEIPRDGGNDTFTIPHLTAMFLRHLRDVCILNGVLPGLTVISVPAGFNVEQRQATVDAATCAGFNKIDVIEEPIAAALAYIALDPDAPQAKSERNGKVLVFDLGGSTLDLTLLEIAPESYIINATAGDTLLGGDDWDKVIWDHWVAQIEKEFDMKMPQLGSRRLLQVAEKAKRILSTEDTFHERLPYFTNKTGVGFLTWDAKLDRQTLANLVSPFIERMRTLVGSTLEEGETKASDVDTVLLVGAMTYSPMVQQMLKEVLPSAAVHHSKVVSPEHAVSTGAALRAAMLNGNIPLKNIINKQLLQHINESRTHHSTETDAIPASVFPLPTKNTPWAQLYLSALAESTKAQQQQQEGEAAETEQVEGWYRMPVKEIRSIKRDLRDYREFEKRLGDAKEMLGMSMMLLQAASRIYTGDGVSTMPIELADAHAAMLHWREVVNSNLFRKDRCGHGVGELECAVVEVMKHIPPEEWIPKQLREGQKTVQNESLAAAKELGYMQGVEA